MIRITIHDLTAVEREFLDGLFAQSLGNQADGGYASTLFATAAIACAAARGIRAHTALAITSSGLVMTLPDPSGASA